MSHSEIENSVDHVVADTVAPQAEAVKYEGPLFADLGLAPVIQKALETAGYTQPTPIQAAAIPVILQGQDVMASAQTGTGKTAAFMLPSLQKLAEPTDKPGRGPRVLVLTPTRELAQQVTDAASKYGKGLKRLRVVSIVGGTSYFTQNKLLAQPVDILVATPGRLIDHLERGRVDFHRLELLVLDEADRMLDMGFSEAVETIAAATPKDRQTALFSATLEGVVGNLADRLLKTPHRINIASARTKHENIEQRLHLVDDLQHKNRILDHLLADVDLKQAIVFTATKRDADSLADDLATQGHAAAALHGDMSQRDRNRTLLQLRRGQVRVLVATDVAARGIDVNGITHVINYDLPKFAEDYVHRIGRTGRAGANGIAISFAGPRDRGLLVRIERFTGQPIKSTNIPGLEPKFKPRDAGARSGRPPRRDGEGQGQARRSGSFEGRRESFGRDGQRRDFGARDSQGGQGQRRDFAPRGDAQPRREGFAGDRDFNQRSGPRREPAGNRDNAGNTGRTGFRPDARRAPQGNSFNSETGQRLLTTHELGIDPSRDNSHRRTGAPTPGNRDRRPVSGERRPAAPGAGRRQGFSDSSRGRTFSREAGSDWSKD